MPHDVLHTPHVFVSLAHETSSLETESRHIHSYVLHAIAGQSTVGIKAGLASQCLLSTVLWSARQNLAIGTVAAAAQFAVEHTEDEIPSHATADVAAAVDAWHIH